MAVGRRPLGRSGLEVSEIGFGCGPGARLMVDEDALLQATAIRRALDLGITYFDTAAAYGDGRSEANLGRALRTLGVEPVVGTKVTLELADLDDIEGAVSRSIEGSLGRLGLKRLPLVHLHNRVGAVRAPKPDIGSGAQIIPADVLGPKGVVETLRRLRDRGLVGAIGCCAFGGEQGPLEELIDSEAFDSMLVHTSILNVTGWQGGAAADLRDYGRIAVRAVGQGMGIVALRVLEAGVLTGRPGDAAPATPNAERASALGDLLEDAEATLVEPALRFSLANPAISTTLVGFSDLTQIEAAAAIAAKGPLPRPALRRIAELRDTDFGRA